MLPLQLLPWLFRRIYYVIQQPAIAALGSLVYAVVLISGLGLLYRTTALTSVSAVVTMGIAGSLSCLVMFFWLRSDSSGTSGSGIFALLKENWVIARWLVASATLVVVAGQAQVFISSTLLGMEEAGEIRVLQLFAQPMILIINALAALTLPLLSADFGLNRINVLKNRANKLIAQLLVITVPYAILLFVFAPQIESLLFRGKFASVVSLIPLWGLIPVILSVNLGHSYSLQAIQRPYALLIVSVVWLIATVFLGIWFAQLWGIAGVTLSTIVGYLVNLSCFAYLYYRWVR
jgi:O-antigen/teichoic acid export membrane protein